MKKYFIHINNVEEGPFSIEELKSKKLNLDTPIWFEGLNEWTTVEKVEDLNGIFIKNTPPQFKPKSTHTIPDKQVGTKNSGLANSEIIGNEVNIKYKCDWCNKIHVEQFIVCSECKKTRKDIWWDKQRQYSYGLIGFVIAFISAIVMFKTDTKESPEIALKIYIYCLTGLILGIIFLIVALVYAFKLGKKMKL